MRRFPAGSGLLCRLLLCVALTNAPQPAWGANGQLELTVTDEDSGEPMAAQLLLLNQRQQIVHPPKLIREGDWSAFDGTVVLKLPPGQYTFRLRRGAEYKERTGSFQLRSAAADHQEVSLPRFVEMTKEGWWSGDIGFQPRAATGMAERVLAADLHLVTAASHRNGGKLTVPERFVRQTNEAIGATRIVNWEAGCDRRRLGALWLMRPELPGFDLSLPAPTATSPSSATVAQQFRNAGGIAHLGRVTHWNAPVWIALGAVDTVGILHGGLGEKTGDRDADRPFDAVFFPGPQGAGRWAQHVYFQFLEAGIRLAPAAGSEADVSGNSLGTQRTYAHCGSDFTTQRWCAALREGRTLLTNGPLLRPTVNDQLPGHVFQARKGERLELDVALTLSTAYPVEYLEIIQNGQSAQQVRLQDWAAAGGRLPPVIFEQSGWLLIRAVASDPDMYRFAMTAPYYVEFDDTPRHSKQAAQFMLDWLNELDQSFPNESSDERQTARQFWEAQVTHANAE